MVVSGAATESARLLLNSKSRLFPGGLGNRYDWVLGIFRRPFLCAVP